MEQQELSRSKTATAPKEAKINGITMRTAGEADAERLIEIYNYYVVNTAVTFECTPPTADEFRRRIRETLINYPYLVAEYKGVVVGYIYAGRFRPREAYDWAASTSIYVDRDFRHRGIGKRMYEELERILRAQNVTNVYAAAADPQTDHDPYLSRNSEPFHNAIGYKKVATYSNCAYKLGGWYNLVVMEKVIGERKCPMEPFIPFSQLVYQNGMKLQEENDE